MLAICAGQLIRVWASQSLVIGKLGTAHFYSEALQKPLQLNLGSSTGSDTRPRPGASSFFIPSDHHPQTKQMVMQQAQKQKTKSVHRAFHPSILTPHPFAQRKAADINQTPAFGSGVLLPEQARRKPIETVCSLFDYGMDGSLIAQWDEWEYLAITSSADNEYSEGSSRARLLRFGVHFKPLILAWLQLYLRITPESLRPPVQLPAGMQMQAPDAVIRDFVRKYHRTESLKELWSVLDAVLANPATPQKTRINLLSSYEVMACITEASFALKIFSGNPRR